MYYLIPKQIQKNWIHISVWTAMLIYVGIAPELYTRFILREGKPVQLAQSLPPATDQISFAVDGLDLIKGQELFNLWGWAFFRGDNDQSAYERWIVLQSNVKTYFFSSKSFRRRDVESAFEDVDIDLSNTGFFTSISKLAVEPGMYQIGILFKHKSNNNTYYIVTNKMIIRTKNQIRLTVSKP
jgi:hypothetical protein